MVDESDNLSDDCFEEMLIHKLASTEQCKVMEVINEYLKELKNEKVCEYDPVEFNKDPRPLGRWDRLITAQNIRIETVEKIILLIKNIKQSD